MISCRSSFSGVHLNWSVARIANAFFRPSVNAHQQAFGFFRKMEGNGPRVIDQQGKNKPVLSSFHFNPKEGVSTSELISGCQQSSKIIKGDMRKAALRYRAISSCDHSYFNSDGGDPIEGQEKSGNSSGSSIRLFHHAAREVQSEMLDTKVPISPSKSVEEVIRYESSSVAVKSTSTAQPEEGSGALGSIVDFSVRGEVERHAVSIEVDGSLLRFVKGKGGETQQEIEREFGVNIKMPSSKGETSVVIEGSSLENVKEAITRINGAVEEGIRSPLLDYSHFVSLPLAIYPELVEKLSDFQNASVLPELGIDKSIFIKPKTFHLTVLMLKLWNTERVAAAAEVLQRVSPKVLQALDNRPISIRLKGLECMKGSPVRARVLYAPVEEVGGEGRLMRACEAIIEAYAEAGLVLEKEARQTLKLHATLMNARHRRRSKTSRKRDSSFDARAILGQFGNEDWGEYLLREAHLSQRFVFAESGYYHCCGSLSFPA
ncbi:uncharacterized protein LOC144703540 isoform X2 [Wolffia australiana]